MAGKRDYDPTHGVVGRKRHTLTDTDGRLLLAAVTPANLHDSQGGIALLRTSRELWPFLAHCFADQAYWGPRDGTTSPVAIEIVQPKEIRKGVAVQTRR